MRWLMQRDQLASEDELIPERLTSEFLLMLLEAMPGYQTQKQFSTQVPNEDNTLAFLFLVFAGVLVAACEGFDGITTILAFLSLPSELVLCIGLAFAVLSIVVFCGFDLIQVSQQLGISVMDSPHLLDIYLEQLQHIKAIRKQLSTYNLFDANPEDLKTYQELLAVLQSRLRILRQVGEQFDSVLRSTYMRTIKSMFVALAGLLFFGGGFFAGQSVAVFIMPLLLPEVSIFWSVLLFSSVVGTAAFAVYWFVERDGLQKFISGWFGLDENKVEQCSSARLNREASKLESLEKQVAGALKQSTTGLDKPLKIAANRYSFMTMQEETVPPEYWELGVATSYS